MQVGQALVTFSATLEAEASRAAAIVGELPQKPASPESELQVSTAPPNADAVRATPRARRRAAELGLDLAQLTASGPGGGPGTAFQR